MALIRDPATGQLVDDSNVTLGQGLVNTANNLGTVIRGTGQGLLNAAGAVAVGPLDAVRQGLTVAAGGDPASLGTPLSDTAYGLAEQGFSDAGNAASRIGQGLATHAQGAILNLLGAQPAQPVVPDAVQPQAPAAVAAPVAADTPAAAAPVAPAAGLMTADSLAPINAAIAQGLAAGQQAQPVAPVASAGPGLRAGTGGAPGNNGINFFAGNESPQAYLQRMELQDRQARMDQLATQQRFDQAATLSHLNDNMTSPMQKKILLRQLAITSPQLAASESQANQFAGARASAAVAGYNAQVQQAAALQKAQLENSNKLAVAGIGANATLGAAQARAGGLLAAAGLKAQANGGSQRLANTQADNLQSIQNLATAWMAETDPTKKAQLASSIGLLKASQVPLQPQAKDPVTGMFIDPQAQQAGQALQILQYQKQLQQALQQ